MSKHDERPRRDSRTAAEKPFVEDVELASKTRREESRR